MIRCSIYVLGALAPPSSRRLSHLSALPHAVFFLLLLSASKLYRYLEVLDLLVFLLHRLGPEGGGSDGEQGEEKHPAANQRISFRSICGTNRAHQAAQVTPSNARNKVHLAVASHPTLESAECRAPPPTRV